MQRGVSFLVALCLLVVLTVACDHGGRKTAGDPTPGAAKVQPKYSVGWQQIENGLKPQEVLSHLGEPVDVKVSNINTYWYYSDRGKDGPYVAFDTRSNVVDSYRTPR